MKYHCCDQRRLEVLEAVGSGQRDRVPRGAATREAPPGVPRQRTLFVRLLRAGSTLTPDNVRIAGGERIRTVGVDWVRRRRRAAAAGRARPRRRARRPAAHAGRPHRRDAATSRATRCASSPAPAATSRPRGFDPLLSRSSSRSRSSARPTSTARAAHVPAGAGRRAAHRLPREGLRGFRRLMLDRLSLLVPDWTERTRGRRRRRAGRAARLRRRRAVATARTRSRPRRISPPRAGASRCAATRGSSTTSCTRAATRAPGCTSRSRGRGVAARRAARSCSRAAPDRAARDRARQPRAARRARGRRAGVRDRARRRRSHERSTSCRFYTWGDAGCCLPRGRHARDAARAITPRLQAGDVLVFEEVREPDDGEAEDADRAQRQVVRLTRVDAVERSLGRLFDAPPIDATGRSHRDRVGRGRRAAVPALHLGRASEPGPRRSASRCGNIVLADHGRTIADEALGEVPAADALRRRATRGRRLLRPAAPRRSVPPRFRPRARARRRSRTASISPRCSSRCRRADGEAWWPASLAAARSMPRAADAAASRSLDRHARTATTTTWTPRARPARQRRRRRTDFVVEVEDDGARAAALRRRRRTAGGPRRAPTFTATYRVGNGTAGNVGADAIAHVVDAGDRRIRRRVRNPLPARRRRRARRRRGGAPRRAAGVPHARSARSPPADYAAATERRADVQRAAATFRWTGCWHTVFVTADRVGGARGRRARSRPRCAATSSASAWRATTSRSTRRASCRSTSRCTSACKPDYFRADVLRAVLRRAVERRAARRHARRSSIPTASRSASRCTSAASSPRRRRWRASSRCASTASSGRTTRSGLARRRRPPDGPARDRAARQRPELPRARRAGAERGRRQVSDARARPQAARAAARRPAREACGCCAGVERSRRRRRIENRAGLSAIAYRIGVYAQLPRQPARRALVVRRSGRCRRCARATTTTSRSGCSTPWPAPPTCSPSTRSASPTSRTCAPPASASRCRSWAAHRLPPAPGRRRRDLARVRARDAAGAARRR